MSTNGGEQVRDEIRSLLNFQPAERVPCTQVLGIGLTPEVCENDESLRRWIVCNSLKLVQESGEDVMDAIAQSFDTAEDQCDFFDLPMPEERTTDFGPLQAQRERQATLGGERPQAARTGRRPTGAEREAGQRPLTGAEQVGLGGEPAPERPLPPEETEDENGGNGDGPARLSEFSGFEDTDGCEEDERQLVRALNAAQQRNTWPVEELVQPVDVAERNGCITADDAGSLRQQIRHLGRTSGVGAPGRGAVDRLVQSVGDAFSRSGGRSEERRLIDRAASLATSTDPFSGDEPPSCTQLYTTVEQFIEVVRSADRPPIGVDASREVADSLRSVASNVDIAANTTGCFGDARGAVNRAMTQAVNNIDAGEEPSIEHLRAVLQQARGGQGNR